MPGISPVLSTPAAGSRAFAGEHRNDLSKHIFRSYTCAFLEDETDDKGCSVNPVTGSPLTCRRSPRLLSNGYYILSEDSFLSDEEGNMTLTPSQTSVTYKENLVCVFRRRKKIRCSLASLFNLSASNSWLSSTDLSHLDSSHGDDSWADGCSKLEVSQTDIGDSDLSECKGPVSQRQDPATLDNQASLSKDKGFIQPRKLLCASLSCLPFVTDDNEETLSSADSKAVQNILSQMAIVIMCLIISISIRSSESLKRIRLNSYLSTSPIYEFRLRSGNNEISQIFSGRLLCNFVADNFVFSFVPRYCCAIFCQSCHIFQNSSVWEVIGKTEELDQKSKEVRQ